MTKIFRQFPCTIRQACFCFVFVFIFKSSDLQVAVNIDGNKHYNNKHSFYILELLQKFFLYLFSLEFLNSYGARF